MEVKEWWERKREEEVQEDKEQKQEVDSRRSEVTWAGGVGELLTL